MVGKSFPEELPFKLEQKELKALSFQKTEERGSL